MNCDLGVNKEIINRAFKSASTARNELTIFGRDQYNTYRHHAKVCCVCDRLIQHTNETWINASTFQNPSVKHLFHQDSVQDVYGITPSAFRKLKIYYTQKFFTNNVGEQDPEIEQLNKIILSPCSYGKTVGKRNSKKQLGCCKECVNGINTLTRKDTNTNIPPSMQL